MAKRIVARGATATGVIEPGVENRAGRGDSGAVRGAYGRLGAPQRTEFRQSVLRRGIPRLAAGAFALTVGTAIARSYTLYDLPPDIVQIVPEYEDYRYVLVDDDIVIVDPDTYEIVDVIRGLIFICGVLEGNFLWRSAYAVEL